MISGNLREGAILAAPILVVDDKADNVRLLEGLLRVAGYTSVESTTDPTLVADLYRRNRYSLILLDLQMPVMDGFEVMEQLKEIEGEGYLPVLVITAQPNHKLRALEAGARDFVGKPFDIAELRARVRNAIEVRLLHLQSHEYAREIKRANDAEFALAEETQRALLPPRLPQFENYRIHAYNSPTRFVGGDFYDFLPLGFAEWMGILADVSGKGISAALLSSMVLGAISTEFRAGVRPEELLARVNRLICERSLDFQYVTLFLFLLNPLGAGQFISAGHNVAYVVRTAGKIEKLRPESFAVGMFESSTWKSRSLHLEEGDILFVYSDGLTDAQNPQEQMFGEARLLDVIREAAPGGAAMLEAKVLTALAEFTCGRPQTDDITFLAIQRLTESRETVSSN